METHTPEELQSGAKELGVDEAMTMATFGAGEGLGAATKAAAPFLEENVLPAIERGVPYAGRVLKFAEEAPSAFKAAARGASTGAAYGGVEGAFRGHPVRDALVGGAGGALIGAGAYGLGSMASPDFRNVPFAGEAEPPITAEKPLVGASVNPPISVRRVPGEIAPEHVGAPAERVSPFPGQGTQQLPGNGVIVRPIPLLPASSEEVTFRTDQNGTKWAKLPNAPAEVSVPKSMPAGEAENYARQKLDLQKKFAAGRSPINILGKQLEESTRTPRAVGADVPFKPSVGQTTSDIVNSATEPEAVRPLAAGPQKGKTLRDIISEGPPKEPVAHRATITHEGRTFGMEAANGRRMYEATQGDTALAKQVHDLKNTEVRQAFVNGGGDVNTVGQEGQRFKVGDSSSKERAQQFNWLLDQGFKPRDIIALARRKP
jgi:hypothetical protein